MEQQTVPKQRGAYLNPYVILMTWFCWTKRVYDARFWFWATKLTGADRWMLIQLLDRATPELLDVFRCRSPKERLECIRSQK